MPILDYNLIMFIEWNNKRYNLGIPTIDNQHRELFVITNQLHDLLEKEQYQSDAVKILKRLYAYTSYHFASEEGLLEEYSYPEINNHKNIHKTFTNKIKEFLKGVREKRNFPLAPLQDFLVEWILKHIQGEDVKYTNFFKEASIKPDVNFSVSDKKRNNVIKGWEKQKLLLEIQGIDNQHKELIYILQQTNDLQHTGESRKRIYIPIIIKKLFYYSQFHFSYEEEHMAKNQFPLLKEQQDFHNSFIKEIIHFAELYKSGMTDITDEIIHFLKDWTIEHILTEDKKYKVYLESEREVKPKE